MSENKIKLINGDELDLSKISDIEAEVKEAQHKLCLICEKYNVPFFSISIFPKDSFISQHFYLKGYTSAEEYQKRLNRFFFSIDQQVKSLTHGQLGLATIRDEPDPEHKPLWQ